MSPPPTEEVTTTMCGEPNMKMKIVDTHTKFSTLSATAAAPASIHFILVHGFKSGGWCWYKIHCLMEKHGYKVSCPDLKSAGIDPTDPDSLHSFDEYNQPLIDLLSSLPDNEKVILVGHSAGGISVTHATHKFGERIHLAIYVAATMLRLGFQTDQDVKDGVPEQVEEGEDFKLKVGADVQNNITYPVISPEDLMLASLLSKPKGPVEAIKAAKFVESPDIDKVKRVYIKTVHDQVMKPRQQDSMIKRWKPLQVFSIESDHNPIVSAPQQLFDLIIEAVKLNI